MFLYLKENLIFKGVAPCFWLLCFPQRVLISLSCVVWKEFKATIHIPSWALCPTVHLHYLPSWLKFSPGIEVSWIFIYGKEKVFWNDKWHSQTSLNPGRFFFKCYQREQVKWTPFSGLHSQERQPLGLRLQLWELKPPGSSGSQDCKVAITEKGYSGERKLLKSFFQYSLKLFKV